MPADSDPLLALPHTWRPLGVRVVSVIGGVLLAALCIGAWWAIGGHLRARFSPLERLTMVVLGLLAVSVWFALIRARLSATSEGVAVVNGYKRRDLEWAQIVAVRLRRGAPWAEMDLADGTTIPVMAIQGSDGVRATTALKEIRAVLADRSRTERDD